LVNFVYFCRKKGAALQLSEESEVRTVGGKEKRYQKKAPLSYVLAPAADQQGNG